MHAVERVSVVQRQYGCAGGMRGAHRQLDEAARLDGGDKRVQVSIEFAQSGFDGHLPNRGGRHTNPLCRFDESAGGMLQPRRA
jgi:hypothetical protein